MYRNVLVPVDGSVLAEHALPWAVAAAGPSGTVHLVHVHEYVTPAEVEGMTLTGSSLDLERRDAEAATLTRLADRVRAAAPGLTVTTRRIDPDVPFVEAITQAVADAAADLVVAATHGRGPVGQFFLGSVTGDLVRHSPAPVLVLRPREPDAPPDPARRPKLHHLIVPLDGSALAEQSVGPAVQLGGTFGADYTLLLVLDSVYDPAAVARFGRPDPPGSFSQTTPGERAEWYLEGIAQMIDRLGGRTQTRLVREGPAADAILAVAGEQPATGVALATHARTGLSRLLMGGVAEEVSRKAPGPVLVFHPPG